MTCRTLEAPVAGGDFNVPDDRSDVVERASQYDRGDQFDNRCEDFRRKDSQIGLAKADSAITQGQVH